MDICFPKLHNIKITHNSFNAVNMNIKNFEVKLNDCNYQLGDYVLLHDIQDAQRRPIMLEIIYLIHLNKLFNVDEDIVVFSFSKVGTIKGD